MKDQSILEDAMVGKTCPWKAEWRWYDNPSNIQEFNKALLENNLPLFDAQGKDKHLPAYGLGGYFADLQASPQEGTSRPALEPRAIRGGAYAYHAKWTKEECKADVGGWLNSEEMGAEYHVLRDNLHIGLIMQMEKLMLLAFFVWGTPSYMLNHGGGLRLLRDFFMLHLWPNMPW
jgi:hypothetical protein